MLQLHATLLTGALAALAPGLASAAASGGGPSAEAPNASLPPKVTTVFKAAKLHLGDGRVLEDGMVVVENGTIRKVGKDLDVPQGANLVEHAGSLTPGLIALHSHDGAGAEIHDATRPILPEADLAYAYRPDHADFGRCVEAGITSLVLSPGGVTLVPGTSAVVKTAGREIVKRRAQLVLGLSSAALRNNEWPTSYSGAMQALEALFTEPKGLFARAASGDLPVLMEVRTRDEIARALAFAGEHGLKGALYGSDWAEELVPAIAQSGLAVICSPADVGDDGRAVRSVLALAEQQVPFGFGLDAPERNPWSLRFAAARAVRNGLDPERALQALTGDAAKIAGVADKLGRIEAGRAADLVLWSGDPLDLGSAIEAVYVDGRHVEGGQR